KLSARGVTIGCDANNYCPDQPVTRQEMAAFILRALGETNPPVPSQPRFSDVLGTNFFAGFIDRLAITGITLGCDANNFCPTDVVTRSQMAAFLVRAFNL
ncbi:MAG TPA: S-layer homology domain-containing protein, partial [Blastocatellia bacterium]|nr:S-layer homology domain-containing protein [Blastocatellia bacterium]